MSSIKDEIRVVLIGCGFWSRFQAPAWLEEKNVKIVGLYNRTRAKSDELSASLGGVPVFDSVKKMIEQAEPHVVDIITNEETHKHYTLLAARMGCHVITQKPMATNLKDCQEMINVCQKEGVKLFVHDNWRWQSPIAGYRRALKSGEIGQIHRGRITYANSFPVFDNQPFLKEAEKFILMDIGTHLFDTARSLYGEAKNLFCLTKKVNEEIKGEDVATVLLDMEGGVHLTIEMSYASPVEYDDFPYTRIHTEGKKGSLELAPELWIRKTISQGWERSQTTSHKISLASRTWADPDYILSTTSCEPAIKDIVADLRGDHVSELRGESYLNTMLWVFACYRSAEKGIKVNLIDFKRSLK